MSSIFSNGSLAPVVRSSSKLLLGLGIAALSVAGLQAQSRVFRLTPDADTCVSYGGPQAGQVFGANPYMETYQYAEARSYFMYVRFDLSVLPLDAVIEEASLTFSYVDGGTRKDRVTPERFSVFGLLDRTGNTPQRWDEGTLSGSSVGSEVVSMSALQFDTGYRTVSFEGLNENMIGGSNGNAGLKAVLGNSPELMRFLEDRARSSDNRVATFIVDNPVPTVDGRGYSFATKENTNSDLAPVLEIKFRRIGTGAEPRAYPGAR